jgi:type IV pilus assembly protein PilM
MALFGRSKTTVGLDIGSGLIKVAVIDHSKKEPELVKVAVVPLLADAIVEGEVMDPGIVAEAIQGALSNADVKGKQVVTAVGGRDVIIKKIQIERVKEQQARELMRWEAEQHVPFDMESVELDFQILDPDGSGVEMTVLLVAAKRELIESKMRILTDAGLDPAAVEVDAFALHNAFEVNHPGAMQGIVALANIGHEVTNINILEDGVPILTRDIAVASARISSASAACRPKRRSSSSKGTTARRTSTRCSRAGAKRSPSASSAPLHFWLRRLGPEARFARSSPVAAARGFPVSPARSPTGSASPSSKPTRWPI